MIILDIGSGNTIKNFNIGRQMIDEIAKRDTKKHEIIFKAQLFEREGTNTPLNRAIFGDLYYYAKGKGYQMTSSVFDIGSLSFLLGFDIPFIKIACRPDLYWLVGLIPRKVPVIMSYGSDTDHLPVPLEGCTTLMMCVPKYPAKIEDYDKVLRSDAISDHTVGLDLYVAKQPEVWEKHLKLETTTGLDAGPFAILPSELDEII